MPGFLPKRQRYQHVYDTNGLLVSRVPVPNPAVTLHPAEAEPEASAEVEGVPLTSNTDPPLDSAQTEQGASSSYVFGSAAAPPKGPDEGAPDKCTPLELEKGIQVHAPNPGIMPTATTSKVRMQCMVVCKYGGPNISSLGIRRRPNAAQLPAETTTATTAESEDVAAELAPPLKDSPPSGTQACPGASPVEEGFTMVDRPAPLAADGATPSNDDKLRVSSYTALGFSNSLARLLLQCRVPLSDLLPGAPFDVRGAAGAISDCYGPRTSDIVDRTGCVAGFGWSSRAGPIPCINPCPGRAW